MKELEMSNIHKVKVDVEKLKRTGVLVSMRISGTNIFQKRLKWYDLGINDSGDDSRPEWFTAGAKYLIPEPQVKALKSIETRARQLYLKYSYDLAVFHPYRWMSHKAYWVFLDEFNELKTEFEQQKQTIISMYDKSKEEIEEAYRKIGLQIVDDFEQKGYEYIIAEGKALKGMEFVDYIIEKALSDMPSLDKISSSLSINYSTALLVTDTEEMTEEELAIKKMEEAHVREMFDETMSPIKEAMNSLYEQIFESVNDLLESIKDNGSLKGKIKNKGKGLVDFFELMAAGSDAELHKKLYLLSKQIDQANEPPNNLVKATYEERIKSNLIEIVKHIENETKEISKTDRFSMIEL